MYHNQTNIFLNLHSFHAFESSNYDLDSYYIYFTLISSYRHAYVVVHSSDF